MVTNNIHPLPKATRRNPAGEAYSPTAYKPRQTACGLGEKAESVTHAVGGSFQSLADTLREKGPNEGVLAEVSSSLADSLESGGKYLQQKGLNGIAHEMTNLIRRNPVPALLVGLGLGCFLARLTARS